MTFQQQADRVRARRTDKGLADFERLLTCTACGKLFAVFEATVGAGPEGEHRWLEPEEFACLECLEGLR